MGYVNVDSKIRSELSRDTPPPLTIKACNVSIEILIWSNTCHQLVDPKYI